MNKPKRGRLHEPVVVRDVGLKGEIMERQKILFNEDWYFQFDREPETRISLNLPHDWNRSAEPDREEDRGSQGYRSLYKKGIYTKTFTANAAWCEGSVFIAFDGVYMNSRVLVNGVEAGQRPYGYVPFHFDISTLLNYGTENTVTVEVDLREMKGCRWYSGAGIYRDVHLHVLPREHIPLWGVSYTSKINWNSPPDLPPLSADITVKADIPAGCGLSLSFYDRDESLPKGSCERGGNLTVTLPSPRLWSAEDPHLYRAELTLMRGGEILDQVVGTIGIRELHLQQNSPSSTGDLPQGLYINRKSTKLKGVCLHHDLGVTGAAYNSRLMRERLVKLKEMGCNAIRTSHNPYSEDFMQLCDELGFYVLNEAFDKWRWDKGDYINYFDQWALKDLEAMVYRDRNRPCVIMWSVGNEVTYQGTEPEQFIKDQTLLVNHIKKLDPTRPVTCGWEPHNHPDKLRYGPVKDKADYIARLSQSVDIPGFNYHEQWYDAYHKVMPDRLLLGTENYLCYRGDDNRFFAYKYENPWWDVVKNDYVIGQFLWTGIDYLGESVLWPWSGWSGGLLKTNGEPYPHSYFHKSVWSDKPVVHIAIEDVKAPRPVKRWHWGWQNMVDHYNLPHLEGQMVRLNVFTNCGRVDLYQNGDFAGSRELKDSSNGILEWHIECGKGSLKAVGFREEVAVCEHEIKTAGEPVVLEAAIEGSQKTPAAGDIITVRAALKDKEGITVPLHDRDIHFTHEGCEWIGTDNGSMDVLLDRASPVIPASYGVACGYVRVLDPKKSAVVTVTSGELTAVVEIKKKESIHEKI